MPKILTNLLAGRMNEGIERRGFLSEFQMRFRNGRRATDNIFVLRSVIEKYII
jgi:hypothetical protein